MTTEQHIIFGSGPVGRAVMDELVRREKSVRIVNRSGNVAHLPEGVEALAGDASNPDITRKICEDATHVYNCTNPDYTKWPELFPGLQAGVLEGAAAAGAKYIAMENLYMYGETHGQPIREDLPHHAHTRKGKVRQQMTEALIEAHEKGRVRVTMGRASDFFGPYVLESAMGERVFKPALAGKAAQFIGNPDMPHTQSYVPDIGKALVILGEHDEALGQAWHIPSPKTVTSREFLQIVYEEAGNPPKIQVMPRIMLTILALFMPILREVKEMVYEFEEPFVMDTGKFEAAFGNPATDLRTAIRTTVQWYRNSNH